jgi:hypothetical protein
VDGSVSGARASKLRRSARVAAVAALLLSGACSGRIVPGAASERERASADGSPSSPSDGAGGTSEPAHVDGGAGQGGSNAGAGAIACDDLGATGAPLPLRRLNASQVERTIADVLGFTGTLAVTDERLFTYRSNVSTAIDATGARGYLDFAEAAVAGSDLERCASASCLPWLLDEVAPRLFRRPLAAEQRARYQALYQLGAADGARWLLEAMVQSPSFLYLDEVVRDDGYLDDYSIAARMALVLWGSNPDAALLARAAAGELSTAEHVREETARMLDDPRSLGGLRDFVDQWLELHRLSDADSRPDLAALGAEVVAALREEPVQLFAMLLAQDGGLRELLTTAHTSRLDPLAEIYGDDILETSADGYALDPQRRAGILSLPGVMAALSHAEATSPTLRGYAVLANFLCTPPPPPPAGVDVTLPEVGPDATARERLEAHFSDDTCGACHRGMDGIGFAFESIDWLGRSRDQENGRAIDDASTFALGDQEVSVDGVAELAATMAASEDVHACVARQWARYATGMPENADAQCLMQRLGEEIAPAGGLRAMIMTYVSSDWFRRGGGEP